MPLYPFTCNDCGADDDRIMSVAEYDERKRTQQCAVCKGMMRRVFTPVALKTDTQRGLFNGAEDGFGTDNRARQMFRRKCRAAGVPVHGRYFPQLCRPGRPLDPFAQCSDTGDIKRKLQLLGKGCEGSINVKPPEWIPEPEKPYRVADRLVEQEASSVIAREGLTGLTPKEHKVLRENVRERITPKEI